MAYCSHTLRMNLDSKSLIAVLQKNKQKVRPVMNYCGFNEHVDACADVCTQKLDE